MDEGEIIINDEDNLQDFLEVTLELWNYAGHNMWVEDVFPTHKCNETDKQMLFTNFD